jgi:hypothetical protein
MTVEDLGRIKGEAIRRFLGWYIDQFGAERLKERTATLPSQAAALIDVTRPFAGIISNDWYDARLVHGLLDAMLVEYSPDERRMFAREAARATIEGTLRGVYRVLFEAIMTPQRYLGRAQSVFSRFYDNGRMQKIASRDKEHLTIVSGWKSHHPVLCDVLLYTGEYVYPSLGCKGVEVKRLACISTFHADCRYVVRWR